MFSQQRRVTLKTLWKNEPRIDSHLLRNEEAVLTVTGSSSIIGFSPAGEERVCIDAHGG